MKAIITSERFYLREKSIEDAQDMYSLNADPEVIKYTGDPPFANPQEAKVFIQNYDHFAKHGFGRWVIVDKKSKKYLGWCGLKKHTDGMIDLGYRIKKEYWGCGIASECAKACIEYGFEQLGIPEIVGRSAKANIASIRILQKVGMQYWKDDTCDGIADAAWYKITKNDYDLLLSASV